MPVLETLKIINMETTATHNKKTLRTWYNEMNKNNFKMFFVLAADHAGQVRFICTDLLNAGDILPLLEEARKIVKKEAGINEFLQ